MLMKYTGTFSCELVKLNCDVATPPPVMEGRTTWDDMYPPLMLVDAPLGILVGRVRDWARTRCGADATRRVLIDEMITDGNKITFTGHMGYGCLHWEITAHWDGVQ